MSRTGIAPHKQGVFDLMRRLRDMPDERYLKCLVAYHAAPTLLGIKPATLICPNAAGRDLEGIFSGGRPCLGRSFGVEVAGFRNGAGALLYLVFDRALLAAVLADPEARDLLAGAGYDVDAGGVDGCLDVLRRRMAGPRFPHEVGIFLGYPPRDVRGFMRDRGRGNGCRGVGCWRTYHDVDEVVRQTDRYNRLKARAAESIVAGVDPVEVAARIRDAA